MTPAEAPLPNSYWLRPGLILAGEYPGDLNDSVARQKLGILLDSGIRRFLDLTEEAELRPYEGMLRTLADERGIEVEHVRFGYPDNSVPTREGMRQILHFLSESETAEIPTYVHCWGGIGRTGTVTACHLIEGGQSPEEALRALARHWEGVQKRDREPETPRTPEQMDFVRGWKARQDSTDAERDV